jgi:hypothetical protein
MGYPKQEKISAGATVLTRIPVVSSMESEGLLKELGVPVRRGFPVPGYILIDKAGIIKTAVFSYPLTGIYTYPTE